MTSTPILINCRDRLEPLLQLLDYLERANADRIYLIDNDSAYPPLLEYFERTPHSVIRLGRNIGRLAPWDANLFAELGVTDRFVFSDPDIVPIEDCPLDAIEYFGEILDRFPDRDKVGFGLRVDDLPDAYPFKEQVIRWESQFWRHSLAPRIYDALIDTTFALHRAPIPHVIGRSVRTGHPYLARHTPWYVAEHAVSDDEAFYRSRAEGSDVNHWGREFLPDQFATAIAERAAGERPVSTVRLNSVELVQTGDLIGSTGWHREPAAVEEERYTPWAKPGWHSWNDMSPEKEICDFLGSLVAVLRPRRVIETGTGQGFVTRRVAAQLGEGQHLDCYESDPIWREALASLRFFEEARYVLSSDESPDEEAMAVADLCIIDSDFSLRSAEILRWWRHSRDGSVVFVHDVGNGHPIETPHARVHATIMEAGIPGIMLDNPRGAFVGVKPQAGDGGATQRLEAAERTLGELLETKTFRYTATARAIYARVLGRRF